MVKLFPRPVSNGVGKLVLDGEAVAVAIAEVDDLVLVVVFDLEVDDEGTAEMVMVSSGTEASSLRSRIRGALGGSLRSTSSSPLRASVVCGEDLRSLILTTASGARGA